MATSVAWGVILATVVTLLVVPAGYLILEDIIGVGKSKRAGGHSAETVQP
jgi:predicted RND superfamily exporter protein